VYKWKILKRILLYKKLIYARSHNYWYHNHLNIYIYIYCVICESMSLLGRFDFFNSLSAINIETCNSIWQCILLIIFRYILFYLSYFLAISNYSLKTFQTIYLHIYKISTFDANCIFCYFLKYNLNSFTYIWFYVYKKFLYTTLSYTLIILTQVGRSSYLWSERLLEVLLPVIIILFYKTLKHWFNDLLYFVNIKYFY